MTNNLDALRKKMRDNFSLATTDNNFLDELKRKYDSEKQVIVAPTNDEMYAAQVDSNMDLLASFFDLGSPEEARMVFEEAARGQTNETIDTIMSTTEKENEGRVQEDETIRAMSLEDANKKYGEEAGDVFDVPQSRFTPHENKDVVSENSGNNTYSSMERSKQQNYYNQMNRSTSTTSSTSSSTNNRSNQSSPLRSATSNSQSSSNSNANRGNTGDEPVRAMDYFGDMNSSIQRLAIQRTSGWNKDAEPEDEIISRSMRRAKWHKKAIYKAKRFFKTGKGRITIKMGIAMALQIAMGVVGKRYEFDNAGQMAMMFSMMLASFFITRELAEEGIDATGIGF